MNVPEPLDAGARTRGAVSNPANTADAVALANGTQLRLRAVDSDDGERLAALFARLSPQSRYRRFLSPKSELTPRELSYFTDIDHVHHVAIAAIDDRGGSMMGVARYVRGTGRAGHTEMAFVVADELQGMGIGTTLATRTVERARANGVTPGRGFPERPTRRACSGRRRPCSRS
jgi:GNAT superfamily N-acetyltransferase